MMQRDVEVHIIVDKPINLFNHQRGLCNRQCRGLFLLLRGFMNDGFVWMGHETWYLLILYLVRVGGFVT